MANWIKSHKAIVALLIVIGFLLFRENPIISSSVKKNISTDYYASSPEYPQVANMGMALDEESPLVEPQSVDTSSNRMVIQTSNISLLVTDVRKTGDKILAFAKNNGGYMVYTSYSKPTESPFASITVRIPTKKLDKALSYFKGLAAKVTNENLVGTDVTQEHTDIQARLATLNKTKAKFEDILDQATKVQDILTVQRELINLQNQIDSLVGQQKAMEKNAELTKVTLYLSTDELALPYTPDNTFRPNVVFKYAVRSFLTTLTKVATALIWIVVYSPLVVICVLIYIFYKRRRKRRSPTSN